MDKERTLVLLKPDAVGRGIIGKIITRFEETGLKLAAIKMIWANEEIAKKHYPLDEEWAKKTHAKSKDSYEKEGKEYPYKDYMDLGNNLQKWLVNFLTEGPIVGMVLEGYHAIELVRKMIGSTEPRQALPGTIRGDFFFNRILCNNRQTKKSFKKSSARFRFCCECRKRNCFMVFKR